MRYLSLVSALSLCAPVLSAQSALISIVNGDTALIERFTRTATRLEGEITAKGGMRQVYAYSIDERGQLGGMTMAFHSPGAAATAPAMQSGDVQIIGDSAVATLSAGGGAPVVTRIKSQALAQPMLNQSLAVFEVIIASARRAGVATATVPVFLAMGGMTLPATLSGLQGDSVSIQIAAQQIWFVTDKAGRIVRAGIPAQKLVVTRADGIAASRLGSKPDYSAPAGAPYTAEDVTVPTTFGHTLGGTFTKPTAATGKVAAVISITGSGAQDRDEYIGIVPKGYRPFRQLADTLGRIGIAMLRMDDRGYGASGGSFAAATSRDFANDIRAGIAWLRTRTDVDPKRIFLAGHSEGGLIAPMVALDEPSLAGIVLMAGPARIGREILLFQVRYGIEHDTSLTAAKRDSALSHAPVMVDSALNSSAWLRYFATYDPIATAKRVKIPVLILQGGDDQQVIASESQTLATTFTAAGNRDVTLRVFPELNHLFIHQPGGNPAGYSTLPTNLASPAMIGMLAEWVRAHSAVMR